VVEPAHLKIMFVKLDHVPKVRWENSKKVFELPPTIIFHSFAVSFYPQAMPTELHVPNSPKCALMARSASIQAVSKPQVFQTLKIIGTKTSQPKVSMAEKLVK